MNAVSVSGRLAAPPIAISEGKTIKFLLRTYYPSRQEGGALHAAIVPCVLFEATQAQQDLLLGKDYKELKIELVGRVCRSSYENAEGERIYSTDVIVSPRGLLAQRVK